MFLFAVHLGIGTTITKQELIRCKYVSEHVQQLPAGYRNFEINEDHSPMPLRACFRRFVRETIQTLPL